MRNRGGEQAMLIARRTPEGGAQLSPAEPPPRPPGKQAQHGTETLSRRLDRRLISLNLANCVLRTGAHLTCVSHCPSQACVPIAGEGGGSPRPPPHVH